MYALNGQQITLILITTAKEYNSKYSTIQIYSNLSKLKKQKKKTKNCFKNLFWTKTVFTANDTKYLHTTDKLTFEIVKAIEDVKEWDEWHQAWSEWYSVINFIISVLAQDGVRHWSGRENFWIELWARTGDFEGAFALAKPNTSPASGLSWLLLRRGAPDGCAARFAVAASVARAWNAPYSRRKRIATSRTGIDDGAHWTPQESSIIHQTTSKKHLNDVKK